MTLRIAMWSGPRNISTAMMRSWGNRPDTFVCDEPLYAHYLRATRRDHPVAQEIVAHHEVDWRKVAGWLTGPVPEGRSVFYQKHMAHHLTDEIDRGWLDGLSHCFLIREPKEMLTSLIKILPKPTIAETGLPQQVEILEHARELTGAAPPVLDSREVLDNPRHLLGQLCDALGATFDECMLSWPPGLRETDGIWARHWYGNVEKSTGFQPYKPKNEPVPDELAGVLAECEQYYEQLFAQRLR